MRRTLRLLACAVAGIVLGLTVYSGLVHVGLARSLFAPTLRGDIALARGGRPGLRVLFVGNSFTFENSLPALVRELAAGDPGGKPIYSVEYAAPGWSLRQADKDGGLTKLLRDVEWDVVGPSGEELAALVSGGAVASQYLSVRARPAGEDRRVRRPDPPLHDMGLRAR